MTHRKDIVKSPIRKIGIAALGAALLTGLAACGGDAANDDTAGESAGGGETITLGFIPSWTDGRSMGNLLKAQLEDLGYTV